MLTLAIPSLLLASLAASAILPTSTPIPPSQDPWYTAPESYEFATPGEVLRVRPAPGNLTITFANTSQAYNILFRTTDSHYRPAWAVTTLFIPVKSNSSALLSYQIPYNSPDIDASPSYSLYAPPDPSYAVANTDIEGSLGRGWFVNVPDHEGSKASFACSVTEGHVTLDSIRAVLQLFGDWSLTHKRRIALWGYSGGSIASEFAAELQVQYAPELQIAGAALGGLVVNLTSAFRLIEGRPFAGLIPAGLVGISTQYPDLYSYLHSQLKPSGPYNATTFLSVLNMTIFEAFNLFANQNISNYFRAGAAFYTDRRLTTAVDQDAVMGLHGVPQIPLFVYKAVHDEVAPISEVDALLDRYCAAGANVFYERNSVGGHLAEETNGDASAFAFLDAVLGGTYNQSMGCVTKNVAINITDSSV